MATYWRDRDVKFKDSATIWVYHYGDISGVITTQSVVSGTLGKFVSMAGTISGQSVVSGSTEVDRKLTATVTCNSTVTGWILDPGIGSLSNYAENKALDHITGRAPFAKPTIYFGFCFANPGESGTGSSCHEVADTNNYARVPASGVWNSASGGVVDNAIVITSPCASGGGWGEVTHYILVDSPTYGEGNILVFDELDAPRVIEEGDNLEFTVGDLVLTLT